MGWPRKNEGCRLYRERADKSYIMVIVENGRNGRGHFDAIGNVMAGDTPSLASTSAADDYLQSKCCRVQWSDMPEVWQKAFRRMMEGWDQTPEEIRGLWKVNAKTLCVKL